MHATKKRKTLLHLWFMFRPWQRIVLGLILGVLVGLAFGHKATYLKPVGTLFINAIHMMIAPVIFTAVVCAILTMNDPHKMRRVGGKTILLYGLCMIVAAAIGLGVGSLIAPGSGLKPLSGDASSLPTAVPSLSDLLSNFIPANPVGAFANGNILQILVFAVILGIAINMAGEKGEPVANFFRSFSSVVFKLTSIVMSFAPFGIFALMAWVTGEFGAAALIPLVKLVGAVYFCCLLHCLIVYAGTLAVFLKLNPRHFFKGAVDAMLMAFSTTSSAATLPVTMRCAEENIGISKSISGFLLPLGTTLNLNGLSIYLGVATVFAANMYGIHLSLVQYITVVISIVLTCMGAGGVPGSALIVMGAVMGSVGLPLGAIPLIAGVDRINDMANTTTNVIGDLFAALVIAKSEKELDIEVYNSANDATEIEAIPSTD
jgi:Na+/H+-dicarboxylate symporter